MLKRWIATLYFALFLACSASTEDQHPTAAPIAVPSAVAPDGPSGIAGDPGGEFEPHEDGPHSEDWGHHEGEGPHQTIDFERDVAPIYRYYCGDCHTPDPELGDGCIGGKCFVDNHDMLANTLGCCSPNSPDEAFGTCQGGNTPSGDANLALCTYLRFEFTQDMTSDRFLTGIGPGNNRILAEEDWHVEMLFIFAMQTLNEMPRLEHHD